MKYFDYLSDLQLKGIFYQQPAIITKNTPKDVLQYALGATLYMPSTRKDIAQLVITKKYKELCSMVLCLEDSIADSEVRDAEVNLVLQIQNIYQAMEQQMISISELPLLFIRVRSSVQMKWIAEQLGKMLAVVSGFAFPKFTTHNAEEYLSALKDISMMHETVLYALPIIETPDVLYKETRMSTLLKLKEVADEYQSDILNIRIGATDFCGLFGIRRDSHTTIYEVSVIRDVIADIVNFFGRDYTVSGPVWEYYHHAERILKPELRQSPFIEGYGEEGLQIRTKMLSTHMDGLIKETLLDKANGIHGKTIIHPSHLKIVQGLQVVSKEEYLDAVSIIESNEHGVIKSAYANKMNEIKPHYQWAQKIIKKSTVFGVYHEKHSFIDVLTESQQISHSR
ncbi:HpcH/HpaI aldolase/citrate lyase family protein [Bacillus sp. 2205SS5-2]|uniref:HpcH/HpaI aldolase/citrate lyase family protein n=1 Tax=Bacillus sp. 2205SS5-2 TaxID=3109031 RepID=UPI003005E25D